MNVLGTALLIWKGGNDRWLGEVPATECLDHVVYMMRERKYFRPTAESAVGVVYHACCCGCIGTTRRFGQGVGAGEGMDSQGHHVDVQRKAVWDV